MKAVFRVRSRLAAVCAALALLTYPTVLLAAGDVSSSQPSVAERLTNSLGGRTSNASASEAAISKGKAVALFITPYGRLRPHGLGARQHQLLYAA
jgi:hypothetical protein